MKASSRRLPATGLRCRDLLLRLAAAELRRCRVGSGWGLALHGPGSPTGLVCARDVLTRSAQLLLTGLLQCCMLLPTSISPCHELLLLWPGASGALPAAAADDAAPRGDTALLGGRPDGIEGCCRLALAERQRRLPPCCCCWQPCCSWPPPAVAPLLLLQASCCWLRLNTCELVLVWKQVRPVGEAPSRSPTDGGCCCPTAGACAPCPPASSRFQSWLMPWFRASSPPSPCTLPAVLCTPSSSCGLCALWPSSAVLPSCRGLLSAATAGEGPSRWLHTLLPALLGG